MSRKPDEGQAHRIIVRKTPKEAPVAHGRHICQRGGPLRTDGTFKVVEIDLQGSWRCDISGADDDITQTIAVHVREI